MKMLVLKETVVQMAKVNGVRWYMHVLRRDYGHILRNALEFEVKGSLRYNAETTGRTKRTTFIRSSKMFINTKGFIPCKVLINSCLNFYLQYVVSFFFCFSLPQDRKLLLVMEQN